MSKRTPKKPVPTFQTPIIETHCHLDYLAQDTMGDELQAITDAGVERIVTIAVSADNLATVLSLCDQHENIWGTQGIHPHEASSWSSSVAQSVATGAAHPKVVAIGEIGLDYYYEHASPQAQTQAFEAQLALAAERDLPVVIHTREADADTRAVLENHAPYLRKKGVIHSFTSSQALADYCLSEGFYLGFNGICTFKNADNVRAVIEATPIDSLVLETDAPYLTPVPYRGRVNSPRFLPLIAEQIAEIKNMPVEALLKAARRNSMALFFANP